MIFIRPLTIFLAVIKSDELYHIKINEKIAAIAVINDWFHPDWDSVAWKRTNAIAIHTLAVDPECQGMSIGKYFVKWCEEKGRELGFASIRLDACAANPVSMAMYKKYGYEIVDDTYYKDKPEGFRYYICFEKDI